MRKKNVAIKIFFALPNWHCTYHWIGCVRLLDKKAHTIIWNESCKPKHFLNGKKIYKGKIFDQLPIDKTNKRKVTCVSLLYVILYFIFWLSIQRELSMNSHPLFSFILWLYCWLAVFNNYTIVCSVNWFKLKRENFIWCHPGFHKK